MTVFAQPKVIPVRNAKFMRWVREDHRCAIYKRNGHRCINPNHAHHIATGGRGTKASDLLTVCLCSVAHDELHRIGKLSFQEKYGVDLYAINAELQTAWKARQR